ncbi:unnamed protein product [Brassicogethes aeneus]|uniref:Kinesin motor domain-containing protein n=1 Tax=Brassicogethes aeneus TaxID=1431903 RepID=A0A9P0B951_BRAAE|nr:unnamed protein product [Brassicogethes aeneus]
MATSNGKKPSQNISVYVRVRPLSKKEIDTRLQSIVTCKDKKIQLKEKLYSFDGVFSPASSQLSLYTNVVEPMIDDVIKGYNCTVFAYGQTGSGKTFTMSGGDSQCDENWKNDVDAGFIPRAAGNIIEKINLISSECAVRVSYLELYNEEIRDLLSDDVSNLMIYNDPQNKGSVCIIGLKELNVMNKTDIYHLLSEGMRRKKMACTNLNANSSRSHTVFTITVHNREPNENGEDIVKIGKLNLVDLAGSESMSRAGTFNRIAEVAGINKSLLTLGRVIKALAEKNQYVPYRDSKLTRILQDSLGGKTKTCIVATVSPASSNYEDTLSTLEYANRAQTITNCPQVNMKTTKYKVIDVLNKEVEKLKRHLLAIKRKKGVFMDEEEYKSITENIKENKEQVVTKKQCINYLNENIKGIELIMNEKNKQWDELKVCFEQQREILRQKKLSQRETRRQLKTEKFVSQAFSNKEKELTSTNEMLNNLIGKSFEKESIFSRKISNYKDISSKHQENAKNTITAINSTVAKLDEILEETSLNFANVQTEKPKFYNQMAELEEFEKEFCLEGKNYITQEECKSNALTLSDDISMSINELKSDLFEEVNNLGSCWKEFQEEILEKEVLQKKSKSDLEEVVQEMVSELRQSQQNETLQFLDGKSHDCQCVLEGLDELEDRLTKKRNKELELLQLYIQKIQKEDFLWKESIKKIKTYKSKLTHIYNEESALTGNALRSFAYIPKEIIFHPMKYIGCEGSEEIKVITNTKKQLNTFHESFLSDLEQISEDANRLENDVKDHSHNTLFIQQKCDELYKESKMLREEFCKNEEKIDFEMENVLKENKYDFELIKQQMETHVIQGLNSIKSLDDNQKPSKSIKNQLHLKYDI